MIVIKKSILTGIFSEREIDITFEQLKRAESRQELIQNVVPHLGKVDREFIISGMTEEEQGAMFVRPEELG